MYTYISKQELNASDFVMIDIGDYHPYEMLVSLEILDIQQHEDYSDLKIKMTQIETDDIGLEVYDDDGNELGEYVISFKAIILLRMQNKYINEVIRRGSLKDVPVEGLDTLECNILDCRCTSGNASLNDERLKKLLDLDCVHESLDYVDMMCTKFDG